MSDDGPDATLRIFESPVSERQLPLYRGVVQRYLGARPALDPEQRDIKWWVNLANVVDAGEVQVARSVLAAFCETPLFALAKERLGPELVFVLEYCILRRYDPVRRPVPALWHFDANIFGLETPMLNVWTPLVDVGTSAPGLSVFDRPRRPAALWAETTEIAHDDGRFDASNRRRTLFDDSRIDAARSDEPDTNVLTPQISAGGAIVFDQQFLHGTQKLTPQMGMRDSLEIRLMPLEVATKLRLNEQYKVMKAPGSAP